MAEFRAERSCLGSLARGSTFFDVGACVGEITRLALETSDIQAHDIHAFEPNPASLAPLNDLGVKVRPVAVGDSPGEATLYTAVAPGQADALGSLRRRELEHQQIRHGWSEYTVEVITIDDYMADQGVHGIDLLKIDVEGHEAAVLRGAQSAIRSGAIERVLFEHGHGWFFEDGYEPTLEEIIPLLGGYELRVWTDDRWEDLNRVEPVGMNLFLATAP